MPKTTLTAQDWIHVLSQVGLRVEAEKDRLSELDGVIGDGDHGVTMTIAFRAVRQSFGNLEKDVTIAQVFQTAGQAFLTTAGGAMGPLMGTMLSDTGKSFIGRDTFRAEEAVEMFEVMEKALVRVGKAQLGDKTMLDALHPAAVAARAAAGEDLIEILRRAADAAATGAQSTSGMISRVGRSSRLGERTLGHEDAGANSIALILHGLEEEIAALSQPIEDRIVHERPSR